MVTPSNSEAVSAKVEVSKSGEQAAAKESGIMPDVKTVVEVKDEGGLKVKSVRGTNMRPKKEKVVQSLDAYYDDVIGAALRALSRDPVEEVSRDVDDALRDMDVEDEDELVDLMTDHVNDPLYDNVETHRVRVAPTLDVSAVKVIDLGVVNDVPIVAQRTAPGFDNYTTVNSLLAATNSAYAHFTTVTRSAATVARNFGDLSATAAFVAGRDGVEATEATVTGLTGRIACARIAASQGATASPNPANGYIDVRTTTLATLKEAIENFPDHLPIYMPSGLSADAMLALVSLLVPGGPGAYSWRYRAGAGNANVMPAATRYGWPGGTNKMLLVTENAVNWVGLVVGGGALNLTALKVLEWFYRRHWGHALFDAGYKTAMALSCVYMKPDDVENDRDITPGHNFDVKQVTRVYTVNGNPIDLRGPTFTSWDGTGGAFQLGNEFCVSHTATYNMRSLRPMLNRAYELAVDALEEDPFGEGELPNYHEISYSGVGMVFHVRVDQNDTDVAILWDAAITRARQHSREEGNVMAGLSGLYTGRCTGEDVLIVRDPMAPQLLPGDIVRNVYGAVDDTNMMLPRLSILSVLGLIANITVPARSHSLYPLLAQYNLQTRTRLYGAHLHLANFFMLAKLDVWPATLAMGGISHSSVLAKLHSQMLNLCPMEFIDRDSYPTQNYNVLENGFVLTGTKSDTSFVGFRPRGTWRISSSGVVDLKDKANSYVAVEAAVRGEYSTGGTVDASGSTHMVMGFNIVRGVNGYINPLCIAPVVWNRRGVAGIAFEAATGRNCLASGRNGVTVETSTS